MEDSSTSSGGATAESSKTSATEINKLMRSFRERFDPLYPVIVRRVDLADDWGDTGLVRRQGEPHLLIRINRKLSTDAQLLVCVHELGHVLQWRSNEEARQSDHDAEFGVAYARLWSVLMGE